MSELLQQLQSVFTKPVFLVSFILQMMLLPAVHAEILYIGDSTFDDVADELQKQSAEFQEYGQILNHTDKGAGINNYDSWLYASTSVQAAVGIDAVVISLGLADFSQSRKNAPSDGELDRGINEILNQLDPNTPVFWILPHAYMPNNDTQKEIWQRVVGAVMRAYTSGDWPTLFVVNLEEWALYSDVAFTDLLTRKQDGFSRSGAATVADLVIQYLHNPPTLSAL